MQCMFVWQTPDLKIISVRAFFSQATWLSFYSYFYVQPFICCNIITQDSEEILK